MPKFCHKIRPSATKQTSMSTHSPQVTSDEAIGVLEVGQAFHSSVSGLRTHDCATLVRQGDVLVARTSRDEGLALGIQGRKLVNHERLKSVFERLCKGD